MKNLIFRIIAIPLLMLLPLIGMAQDETTEVAAESVMSLGIWDYLLIAVVLFVLLAAGRVMYNLLRFTVRAKELEIYEKHGLDNYLKERKLNEEGGWLKSFFRQATAAVPIEKERDILFDHSYDGIQELDNNLPPWWVYGFYLTIAIAVFYMGVFHFSSYAKSSAEIYQEEMEQADVAVKQYLSRQSNLVDETNVELLEDEASIAEGKSIFTELCVACHLEGGGGGPVSVGPNLTDEYWLHGGSIVDVFSTIKYGVPEKGMIAWNTQLRPGEIHKVSSYILSLQGTNPPNAKEPQGELYIPDENNNSVDSTDTSSSIGMK